jgi:hypothetical protein
MKHRSGYKSSEFWFTLVSFIFSGLYLIGVIGDSSYKDELIRDISHAVESILLIIGQVVIVYNYIRSRDHIKEVELNATEKEEEKPKNDRKPRTPKSSANKPRTSSSRSRKSNK